MSEAPAKKKQVGEFVARHGIWLSDAGTLSFGKGAEGELMLTEADYGELKTKSVEGRVKHFSDIKNPPVVKTEEELPVQG
jgi:hypothetical protein